jgi:hypothetical protein
VANSNRSGDALQPGGLHDAGPDRVHEGAQPQRRCTVRPRRQEASLAKAKAEEKPMTALPQLVPKAEPQLSALNTVYLVDAQKRFAYSKY